MTEQRKMLFERVNNYFKDTERYEQEQQFNESFTKWQQFSNTSPSRTGYYDLSLQGGNPEAWTIACNNVTKSYQNLITVCGPEGYEGIGYLLNYVNRLVRSKRQEIEIPSPIVDLARMDLEVIWAKEKPVL